MAFFNSTEGTIFTSAWKLFQSVWVVTEEACFLSPTGCQSLTKETWNTPSLSEETRLAETIGDKGSLRSPGFYTIQRFIGNNQNTELYLEPKWQPMQLAKER